ncbi:MAG: GAF domain-containing protein [Deltaproteobacteria bacterium]|nr:GAF domain-containing protein [Deltaproteobacteria bacterium]
MGRATLPARVMNIQALSALLASVVTLAIGASVVLRDRNRKTYVTFAAFTFTVALYHLFTFLSAATTSPWYSWLALWPAAFVPTTAVRFFRAFLNEPAIGAKRRRPQLTYFWTALWCGAIAYGAVVRPIHQEAWFLYPFATYVFGGLYRCVWDLYVQYRATVAGVEKARIRYLMIGGFVATTLAVTDFLPRLGVTFPTIGNVLTILYLYFLSQALFRYRLLDLHELMGKMLVLGSLVVILSVVYGILLLWVGGGKQQGLFILNTIVASFVILILFEPVRAILENAISRWLVRERHELRYRMDGLRRELMNVIDTRDLVRKILSSLEESRRVTHAAIYVIDAEGAGFDLAGFVGPRPVDRIDLVTRRPFVDRLRGGPVALEALERELANLESQRGGAPEKEVETLDAIARTLDEMHASLAIPISGGGEGTGNIEMVIGVIGLRDERLRNAFGVDEVEVFKLLAAQAAITMENSQVFERMKERDRLAALGEMAAGLAHEIRNPLGAIKGAAQLLVGPDGRPAAGAAQEVGEFLSIIVDEVNRLNRVVSQFLDYARPYKGEAAEVDINEVVKKTVQLLETQEGATAVGIDVRLSEGLPRIRGDAEQLRQVFLNLGLNAIQAMAEGGRLSISTGRRPGRRRGDQGTFIEVRFRDTGPGIARENLKKLFIPFFTTKEKGTGLGLPISQRIITHHGGRIEVRSEVGKGSTFAVILPLAEETSITTTGSIARSSVAGT